MEISFFFCHFLLLSPSSSIPIRKQKTLYSGWRAGRGFEEGDTQSMARAEKASWDEGAAELFKLRCVCARVPFPSIIQISVFVASIFETKHPPNGRRRPSHHPRLYNVIRVYICSIHKHVTCSFFCFPEKNGRSDQDRRVLLLISVHLPFVGRHFLFKKLVPSREEEEYWRRKEGTSFLGRRIFARRTQSERGLWTQQLRMPFLARALSLFASFILSALSSPFSEEQKRFSGEEEKEDARKGSSPSHKSRRRISIRALSLSTHRNGEMWGGAAAAAT